jgi:predicted protein tyrosine phosphatase
MLHICSLARLHQTVTDTGAEHVVTLLRDVRLVTRPQSIVETNHLILGMDDIAEPMDGYVHPGDEHVEELLRFVRGWPRQKPMVVHCYAGISRSTAGAFVAACALNPARRESDIAQALRRLSPTAFPNPRIVSIADHMLGRHGRMIEAVREIGPGLSAYEAAPFRLDLE